MQDRCKGCVMGVNNFPGDLESKAESVSNKGIVTISEYCPSWAAQFSREEEVIRSAITCAKIYIDHVGSTAVKDLSSKPIVDILITLNEWSAAAEIVVILAGLGYGVVDECKDTPRYFLVKYPVDGLECFHIHICRPLHNWGRGMVVFRNELIADRELAEKYACLKKDLANKYHNNVPAYILGKKSFIESKLREVESGFSVNSLLTHQRAESNKAEHLQMWMMFAQFSIAMTAAISVYSNDNKYLFVAAIVGFVFMLLWLFFSQGQQQHRSAGDQARRAVLLISGLGVEPSAGQKLRINDGFNVPIFSKILRREEDHFASREVPGYKRLSEMIEESSYWIRDLQRTSAKVMTTILLILAAVVFIAGGAAITSFESDNLISISRAMIAIMVFVVSSDSLGLLLAYRSSAVSIDEIFKRVESAAARGYLKSDILLLMSDYNAAIERAPTALPWVYKFRQRGLGLRWQAYMEAKIASGAAG